MQATKIGKTDTEHEAGAAAVYEIGYHVIPTIAEAEVEQVVSRIRTLIENAGGSFVAEGTPVRMSLAYPMAIWNNGSWTKYTESYFGWIKCDVLPEHVTALEKACKADRAILRFLLISTVREDTRANVRQFVLKEVKRTDTIKPAAKSKIVAEEKEEVSDEKLDEAIEELVAD